MKEILINLELPFESYEFSNLRDFFSEFFRIFNDFFGIFMNFNEFKFDLFKLKLIL